MQPQYPPQQYAPQFPSAQPAYAPQFPSAQPAYTQQYPPQYGQPAYGQPPAPAAAPLPVGSLDDFYDQPSGGGGPSLKFMDANRQPQIGRSYVGIVARPITDTDVRAQTDNNGRVVTYKDGRPKFVMVVPLQIPASTEYPDGIAGWWVKGQARDELARAMAEAGAPAGAPEAGAAIRVTLTSVRPVPNMSPQYVYRVDYARPNNATIVPPAIPTPQTAEPAQPYAQPPMAQPYAQPVQQFAPSAQPVQQFAPSAQPVQQFAPSAQQFAQPVPVPDQPAPTQTAPAQQVPAGFTAEQAALFAKLTGGQA